MELQGQRSLERKPTNLGRNPPQVQREATNKPEPHLIVAGRGIRLSGVSGHPSDGDDDSQEKKTPPILPGAQLEAVSVYLAYANPT